MNNPKVVFAAVIGVVFCFAGYNLWSYFKEQQAIQMEEDRVAEERRIQREQDRAARKAAEEQERRDLEARAIAQAEERKRQEETDRLAREAAKEAQRKEDERQKAEREAAKLERRITKARTLERVEEVPQELIDKLNGLSRRYITDHPDEFLTQTLDGDSFGPRTNFERLIQEDTNSLMLFAAVTPDTDLLQALLDIGMEVNAQNKAGFTPLMFAAAYSTPEAVKFLVGQGADIHAKAYMGDLTSLHVAALLNPNPDVIDALKAAGADFEASTENDMTALLVACSENQNLEVAERLAQLGADLTTYAPDGLTAKGICESRIRGEGSSYRRITDEVNERIIKTLTP